MNRVLPRRVKAFLYISSEIKLLTFWQSKRFLVNSVGSNCLHPGYMKSFLNISMAVAANILDT